MINITVIAILIVELIAAIAIAFAIPCIKTYMDNGELQKLMAYAQIGVKAAEMLFKESGMGEKKKEYVIEFLKSKGYDLDMDALEAVIESAVLEMKEALIN